MSTLTLAIVCAVALGGLIFLFWLTDFILKSQKKPAVKAKAEQDKTKEATPADSSAPTEKAALSVANETVIDQALADDIVVLMEHEQNLEKEAEIKKNERIMRSRLSNTGRMREYYEKKYYNRNLQNTCNFIGSDETEEEQLKLTQDDIRKLIALKDTFDKK